MSEQGLTAEDLAAIDARIQNRQRYREDAHNTASLVEIDAEVLHAEVSRLRALAAADALTIEALEPLEQILRAKDSRIAELETEIAVMRRALDADAVETFADSLVGIHGVTPGDDAAAITALREQHGLDLQQLSHARQAVQRIEQENAMLRQGMREVTTGSPLPNACIPCETVCADCTPPDAIGHSEDLIEEDELPMRKTMATDVTCFEVEDADTSIDADAQRFRENMQRGEP